jgi:hypothetical protein
MDVGTPKDQQDQIGAEVIDLFGSRAARLRSARQMDGDELSPAKIEDLLRQSQEIIDDLRRPGKRDVDAIKAIDHRTEQAIVNQIAFLENWQAQLRQVRRGHVSGWTTESP